MKQLNPVVDPSIYETLIKYYSKKFKMNIICIN